MKQTAPKFHSMPGAYASNIQNNIECELWTGKWTQDSSRNHLNNWLFFLVCTVREQMEQRTAEKQLNETINPNNNQGNMQNVNDQ